MTVCSMNYQHLTQYEAHHQPLVRDLAEVVQACIGRGAEADHLTDPEDPMHETFSRMVGAYMREMGISSGELFAAMQDYERLGDSLN